MLEGVGAKCRLVAGGHRQQNGVDFEKTYTPVCSYRMMRKIMAVSAREGLAMRQFDIHTAFLNEELEEEVYMCPPAVAEGLAGGRIRVPHLKRALYGLRQASHFCLGMGVRCLQCFTSTTGWWRQGLQRRQMPW
jgi:hypothetical protein